MKLTDQPLVSIIVNNFNCDKFVKDAIESALAQSYSNIEVIVVDDSSTDGSRKIIESYNNSVIPVFKKIGGQASTFNIGLETSKSERQ